MDKNTNDILLMCFNSLKIFCFNAILHLMFLRFWLMYFDVQWTIATLDKEWTVFLDTVTITAETTAIIENT